MKWIAKTTTLSIRPYHPQDRKGLLKIAADTAFFGDPIEIYLGDRNIFLDLFYVYYTDYEPEHTWVALNQDKVIGFLTGCFDTKVQRDTTLRKLVPRFFWKLILGKYRVDSKAITYGRRLWQAYRKGGNPSIDLALYPAHLHINVDKEWRGHGIGLRLMQSYLDQLLYAGVPGVHLETSSENEAACRLYNRVGFHLLAEHETYMWQEYIDHPVFNRIYGLKLSDLIPK